MRTDIIFTTIKFKMNMLIMKQTNIDKILFILKKYRNEAQMKAVTKYLKHIRTITNSPERSFILAGPRDFLYTQRSSPLIGPSMIRTLRIDR